MIITTIIYLHHHYNYHHHNHTTNTAKFSPEGTKIWIEFNRETDRGDYQLLVAGVFSCDEYFTFVGSHEAHCKWVSDSVVEVQPLSPIASIRYHTDNRYRLVNVGDNIVFNRKNTLRAKCPFKRSKCIVV